MRGKAQTPNVKGLTSAKTIPNSWSSFMVELFEAIRAGKITEIKLIRTIEIEKRKTIQFTGMNFF